MIKLRAISVKQITEEICRMCKEANYKISPDIYRALENALAKEVSETGKSVLTQILDNNRIAAEESMAICQDSGMVVIFIELGQEVRLTDGDLKEALNAGVRKAYNEGYLRKSVVAEPIFNRKNTGDNTPAVIYIDIVPGNQIKIELLAKGFGSENMSAVKMMIPAEGENGVRQFILDTVSRAGPNPCPPIIVGVGVGGTMEKAAMLAKKATMRTIGEHNKNSEYAKLEDAMFNEINELGIGPGGLGGIVTALAVNIDYYPTHIASIPVAVNICCHASRHISIEI